MVKAEFCMNVRAFIGKVINGFMPMVMYQL
jgi:hypothetical protein